MLGQRSFNCKRVNNKYKNVKEVKRIRADMLNDLWISTIQRKADIYGYGTSKYYETIVFDYRNGKDGKILAIYDNGSSKKFALKRHNRLLRIFSYLKARERRITK